MKSQYYQEKIDKNYWWINPLTNLAAGMITGFLLEQKGMPYSGTDLSLQFGVPAGLGSLEYLVKKQIRKEESDVRDGILIGSSALGLTTFVCGDHAGRLLAKLI